MQLVETKASKLTYQELKENLAVEKLRHLSSVLRYKYGMNSEMVKVNDNFELYRICSCCGEPEFLDSYLIDEALSLIADSEAIRLVMESE